MYYFNNCTTLRSSYKDRKSKTSAKKMATIILIWLSCMTRIILNAIPATTFLTIESSMAWLQFSLDLFPELMFFFTYLMIVITWMELYYIAKSPEYSEMRRKLSLVYLVIFVMVMLTASVLVFWTKDMPYSTTSIHSRLGGLFLGVLSLGLFITVIIAGRKILNSLSDLMVLTSTKIALMTRLRRVMVFISIVFILHCAYIITLAFWANLKIPGWEHLVIWFLYFIFTEGIPVLLILLSFSVSIKSQAQYRKFEM